MNIPLTQMKKADGKLKQVEVQPFSPEVCKQPGVFLQFDYAEQSVYNITPEEAEDFARLLIQAAAASRFLFFGT